MPIQSDGPAPYTAPKAVIDFIEAYRRRGLQVPFTAEVLVKAGVSDTLAPRTLTSLKLLGLVTENGQPTQQLADLRKAPEDEFKPRVAALIQDVYAEVFSYVDPVADPPERIRDGFRSYTPVGQQTRMVTLFLGLCEYAGLIPPSPERKAGAAGGAATRRPNRTPRARTAKAETAPEQPPARPAETTWLAPGGLMTPEVRFGVPAAGGHQLVQGLLRELPPVGARWPKAKLDAWLELQRAVFNVLYEITDAERPSQASHDQGGESG